VNNNKKGAWDKKSLEPLASADVAKLAHCCV